jgi:NAD(P)-dependent dehydrogenase (short-subunit alcohol dehydrogenase family)
VAVVTGGNKGIGFALVKRLAELGLSVVLTARDKQKGEAAVESIRAQLGLVASHVHFLLLDVSDPHSIQTFASSFKAKFGATLDILVSIIINFSHICFLIVSSLGHMSLSFVPPREVIATLFNLEYRCFYVVVLEMVLI